MFVFFVILASVTSIQAQIEVDSINVCERDHQLVADRKSCTRFYSCRSIRTRDDTTEFALDIAVCQGGTVFDMVTSQCVTDKSMRLADPNSCDTYFACHTTRETSEGLLREKYLCPGILRFHPHEKVCTFPTSVPDDMCKSHFPNQKIIGLTAANIRTAEETDNSLRSFLRDDSSKPEVTILPTRNKHLPVISRLGPPAKQHNKIEGSKPVKLSDLNKIAHVITGQLISLHDDAKKDTIPSKKNKSKPISIETGRHTY